MKIKSKIIAMNFLIILPIIVLISFITIVSLYYKIIYTSVDVLKKQSYYSQKYITQYNQKQKESFDYDIFKNMSPYLSSYLANNVACRVQIYDKEGLLLGDSEENKISTFAKDIEGAIEGNKTYIIKYLKGSSFIFMSSPIYFDNETIGCVRYVYSLKKDLKIIKNVAITLIISAILAIILAFLLSYFLSNSIVNPILTLKNASQGVSEGDFNQGISIHSGDEIEELAETFNKMSQSIENYIENLKKEKEKQRSFFDNVTHQLKTPLTSIIGYADLIGRVNSLDDIKVFNDYITKEGNRLYNLVEELLYASKLEKDDYIMKIDRLNLNETLNYCIKSVQPRLDKFSIKIENYCSDFWALGDKEKTSEVFLNILDNAIKHSQCSIIKIYMEFDEKHVSVIIQDNGIGFSEKHKAFEPFYTRDRSKKSSGMGLFICKNLIEKQGGNIEVISKDDEGAKIKIFFLRNNFETIQ